MRLGLIVAITCLTPSGSGVAQQRQQPLPHKPTPALQPPPPSAAQSYQSNQGESAKPQENRDAEQRGTTEHPVIVKVLPTEKTAEERAQEKKDRRDKASSDWWGVWLTLALVGVGTLQFLALIGQAIVFRVQATALRESVDLTRNIADRQEKDMQSSIGEAARAAAAMEQVATGIAASVENTRTVLATQRDFAQRQMRAYLSVRFNGVVLQDNDTDYRFEVRLILANTGHTPAHGVTYRAVVDILPLPLPDNFVFNAPELPITSGGVLGPQQIFTMSGIVNRMCTDEEITEISTGNTTRLYIYGTVNYTDTFGIDRHTNFSQRVEWMRGGQFTGMNTRRHNDAT